MRPLRVCVDARLTESWGVPQVVDHEVIDIDGARIVFADGWGLIRASNTQPALVLRAEAVSPAALVRFPEVGPIAW